jgi:hypothetical protein
MKTFLGIFLFAHALMHYGATAAPGTDGRVGGWMFDPARAPIARLLGLNEAALRQTGMLLWGIGMVVFVAVSLAYFGWLLPHEWLRPLAIGASLFSLLLLGLFWHPWMVAAVAINLIILAVAWFRAV